MPTPTTLSATDVSLDGIQDSVQRTYQRKAFFAERRHWVFYVDDNGVLLYDSSVRASGVWLGPQPLGLAASGAEFSVFVEESPPTSASYVHVVYSDATGGPIFYIRGTLASNGTIAWDAPDEAVAWDVGFNYEKLGITMDYSGNLYVVYTKAELADPNNCTPHICQSTTTDGTWTDGAGYPLQITVVQDASWVPLVSPYWQEVMVVYAAANGNIYSRVLSGGAWGVQVDSGSDIGGDAQAISIVPETRVEGLNGSAGKVARAVYVAFQAADWDLYSICYESGAWGAANTIEVIGANRSANPMLTILDQGDSDGDHMPATLYCFWTPTADAPTAEWVTYRLSRDFGDTWTDEAGEDLAEEWIDETGDGFEVQASGSAYSFSDPDYLGSFYIGLVYTVHRMPPAIRHAGLIFADPALNLGGEFSTRHAASEDLLGAFVVRHVTATADLSGEFIVRHPASADLPAEFIARNTTGTADLLGEFVIRKSATLNLHGEFNTRYSATLNLAAEFSVRHPATEDLYAEFFVNQAALDLYAYFEIGQNAVNLHGEFEVQQEQDENLKGIFNVQDQGDVDLLCAFFVRNAGTLDLPCEFVIRRSATLDLPCEFVIRGTVALDLPGEFVVRHPAAVPPDLLCAFVVRHPDAVNLPAQFRIDKDYISKGLNVSVYRDIGVIA